MLMCVASKGSITAQMSAENNSGPRYYPYLPSFVSRNECRGIVKSAVGPKWSWILRN